MPASPVVVLPLFVGSYIVSSASSLLVSWTVMNCTLLTVNGFTLNISLSIFLGKKKISKLVIFLSLLNGAFIIF
jgi:hypothetical protein